MHTGTARRILILSADTGKTYHSVTDALTEQLNLMNVPFDLLDALKMSPETANALARWGKSMLYRRVSRLLGRGFSITEANAAKRLYRLCAIGADALHKALSQGDYSAVICPHVYSGMMMTEVRRRYGETPPFYFVATDYSCPIGLSEMEADGCFIPHRMLLGDFVRCGIGADRLYACGIPVRACFAAPHGKKTELRQELSLPTDGALVVLRAGNLMAPVKTAKKIRELSKALPADTVLAILCGQDDKLRSELLPLASDRVRVLSFEVPVERYLFAADLVIGKPRGVPVTEAMVCGLPAVLYRELPGTEARNLAFLTERSAAVGATDWKEIARDVRDLLADPAAREELTRIVADLVIPDAAEQICRTVCRSVPKP